MSSHGAHDWWYRCLTTAGIVPEGTTSGERMHKSRHTAGQRVLDATGNLKAVQNLLGHTSIHTTGDIYADWDIRPARRHARRRARRGRRMTGPARKDSPRDFPETAHLQWILGSSGDSGVWCHHIVERTVRCANPTIIRAPTLNVS